MGPRRALWGPIKVENVEQTETVGTILKMLKNLEMLGGATQKCWGHPENVGDKLKMFGKFYIPLLLHPPVLGPYSLGRAFQGPLGPYEPNECVMVLRALFSEFDVN